jgi:hypothetical protein
MGRSEFIAKVADRMEEEPSDGEAGACRAAFVAAIRHGGSLLYEDEATDLMRGILEPVRCDREASPVVMTDMELESLPDGEVVDVDGAPCLMSDDGTARTVTVVPDQRPSEYARSLVTEQRGITNELMSEEPCGLSYQDLCQPEVCCPYCGSTFVTQIWEEGGVVTMHCDSCDGDFAIRGIEPEPDVPSTETLIPELGISCQYDRDLDSGFWHMLVYKGDDDEPMAEERFCTKDEMSAFMDGFVGAYDSLRPGMGLASTESGLPLDIEDVDGDRVVANGRTASRSTIAASIADGRMAVVSNRLYADDVVTGDIWAGPDVSVQVVGVDGDSVCYREHHADGPSRSSRDLRISGMQKFLAHVDELGLEYVAEDEGLESELGL